ncbi:hypothetical protein PCC7424_5403 (plasmid) [Gloeothece citriformis PCC 7424]|uniref:Uncharacterized protein n=1 Tax=Gloeothece citriformis (strain PCC 7424) TaxID=65393 RepID=B7KMF9_GLOC7|nr:hypothetical protein [Gloeothece citriformis]ACK73981.1 hypothetical protein PCC7424_5403 [Gloeothece citriformis PCC 7424]
MNTLSNFVELDSNPYSTLFYPTATIATLEYQEIYRYPYLDVPIHFYDCLLCFVNLQPVEEEAYTTEHTFETLKTQKYAQKDPLFSLKTARTMLKEQGVLLVFDTSKTPKMKNLTLLFSCAGFSVLGKLRNCFILRKRPLLSFTIPEVDNYIVKEAETHKEIDHYFSYLSKRYPQEQNYEREIDNLFTNQSIIFLAHSQKDPSQVIGVSRYTYFIPEYGYYLPCQLANFCEGKHQGEHIILPKNITSMGESLALYDKQGTGKSGTSYLVYQQLIKAILTYKYEIAHTDISYTTYPKGDTTIEALYKDRFGFKHTLHNNENICLQYGTFASQWYLIELERSMIELQYRNINQIFKKTRNVHITKFQ